ncbi:MAG: AMP-dependent synthetase/ligase [Bacteroidota bacterium]|nr:AMP-dependent synthetase/ligase [Bacteroidota bacterium]MDP3146319.1 AMP-dependent synthetase/ligase [Bacteroidota bacterium]MDP3556609.1 AMP-dependent synthetase/ligase [Bacteroidota bacterium]
MEIKRVFDILENLKNTSAKNDILSAKENPSNERPGKKWVNYSVNDFVNNANYVGSALLSLGLNSGDNVAIMANNMPQWNFVDYGAQQVGMPSAPIFPTISNDDLKYILNHCEAKIIFISEKSTYQKLASMEDELPHLKYVFCFHDIDGVKPFSEFLELGKQNLALEKINAIKSGITENTLMTILYTSGTTGQPKGVMISHKNMISNVMICKDIAPFTNKWRALSFLPLNHVYERFLNTLYLYHNVSIYYAENFETIGDNCREIHPEIFVAVPRILERVLEKIISAGDKLSGIKKKIFDLSLRLAERYELDGANGPWYELQRTICDKLVYSKWRAAVGGNVKVIVSGGAALNPRLHRIFNCANLTLLQGYGLTETCVVVAVNRLGKGNMMFGTVGQVVENSQVKISEKDGEILMKGPSLMIGYYKNPEVTEEAIDKDGWFHTGDIGKFVGGKFLKITDRKKEIFKNSSGKYISPVAIENKLKESKFIEHCIVIGEGQKHASALIIPSIANFKEHFNENNIDWPGNDNIHDHDEIKKIINAHIQKVNTTLALFEQLKRCQLIAGNWAVESGEITPKLSLKRKFITEKNKDVILKIFGEGE